jgi:hypothetical protein
VASANDTAFTVDTDTTTIITKFSHHNSQINKVIRINNTNKVITASDNSALKMWNMTSGALIGNFPSSGAGLNPQKSIVELPNGLLAVGSCNIIYICDLASGVIIKNLTDHGGCVSDLKVSMALGTGSGALVSASADKNVKVWDLVNNSFTILKTLGPVSQPITCLVVLPSGKIITGSNEINIWSSSYNHNATLSLGFNVLSMAVYPDGVTVVCGLQTGWIKVFDTRTTKIILSIQGQQSDVSAIEAFAMACSSQLFILTGSTLNSRVWWANATNITEIKRTVIGSRVNSLFYVPSATITCTQTSTTARTLTTTKSPTTTYLTTTTTLSSSSSSRRITTSTTVTTETTTVQTTTKKITTTSTSPSTSLETTSESSTQETVSLFNNNNVTSVASIAITTTQTYPAFVTSTTLTSTTTWSTISSTTTPNSVTTTSENIASTEKITFTSSLINITTSHISTATTLTMIKTTNQITTSTQESSTTSLLITESKVSSGLFCGFFENLDFEGNDIISFTSVNSTHECCSLCSSYSQCGSNQRCNAWTFRPLESICFLKYGTRKMTRIIYLNILI